LITKTIIDLFVAEAQRKPHETAVYFLYRRMTFQELNARSNFIANHLVSIGIKPGMLVPIILEPGFDMICAILGIMKASAGYVPIDPSFPAERKGYILDDTDCKVLLTCTKFTPTFDNSDKLRVINMDLFFHDFSTFELAVLSSLPNPQDIAYVIYTSGSTGKPKGVVVEHSQIFAYIKSVSATMEFDKCSSFAVLGTFSADAGHTALFGSICFGKPLHIIDLNKFAGFPSLCHYFKNHKIDCYKTTPSLMNLFLNNDSFPLVLPRKVLMLGGEVCSSIIAKKVGEQLPTGCHMYNHYGPTETTVGVLTYKFPNEVMEYPNVIPIGKPLDHVSCSVQGEFGEVANSEAGELFISGSFVTRGYLNNDTLNRIKFPSYQINGLHTRYYKTGDYVRKLQDGNFEFLGRVDGQVKMNGRRIELNEIEAVAESSGFTQRCIVVLNSQAVGSNQLVGVVLSAEQVNYDKLKQVLSDKLPPYMLPGRWVGIDKWPLLINNKIDRRTIAKQINQVSDQQNRIFSGDGITNIVKEVWVEILGISDIDDDDDFFYLGGDSMLLIKVGFTLSAKLQVALVAEELFGYLNFKNMVSFIRSRIVGTPGGDKTISFLKARKWNYDSMLTGLILRNKINPENSFPNSSITLRIHGCLDLLKLDKAFKKLFKYHESLNTSFDVNKGQLITFCCLSRVEGLVTVRCFEKSVDSIISDITKPFVLSGFPLIRLFYIELLNNERYLHLDMPHLISDGQALHTLISDLSLIYNTGKISHEIQCIDNFKIYIADYFESLKYDADLEYWQRAIGATAHFSKITLLKKNALDFRGNSASVLLSDDTSQRIRQFLKLKSGTPFQFFLSIQFLFMFAQFKLTDVIVLIPIQNRNEKRLQHIVGLLSNVIPIIVNISVNSSIKDFFSQCRNIILKSLEHQRLPFDEIRSIWKRIHGDNNMLSQSYFSYQSLAQNYSFDGTPVSLYVPKVSMERLPLSISICETERQFAIRLSTNAGVYSKSETDFFLSQYLEILESTLNFNNEAVISQYAARAQLNYNN